MIPPREMPADRESRLDAALGAYFAEAAAGRPIDRRRFLAGHPELAADLERFFDDDDALEELLSPLRPARAPAPAVGTSLGDYELLEVIGTGGSGVVYKARQRTANRLVALKAVRGGALATADGMRRFRAEAETVAALEHPNIVPLYDVGEHAGQSFFTMKLLEGGDLARRVATGTQPPGGGAPDRPPKEAARLMVEVARAVHYAHQRGVLHRDLKPSNVLLDADGRPHVADFGLAKWLTADASLTETGALVGTPGYMAPEQTVGAAATTATDVYGLGTVLYFLLTGRAPFRGATPLEIITQVRERDPEAPSALCPAVDRDLETVCLKCLRKEPAQRYGSAEALAEDLERWQRSEPVTARRAGRAERVWRWSRRNPGVATLSAALALLLLVAVIGLSAGTVLLSRETREKETQRADAAHQREIADEQRTQAVERSRLLRRQVYAADVERASRVMLTMRQEAISDLMTRYSPAEGEDDLRGFEWYYLRWLSQGGAAGRRVLRGHLGHIYSVAFAPDGKTLATAGSDSFIRLWDGGTGQMRSVLWGGAFMLRAVAYSPDGKTLASASDDGTVKLWDVPSGGVRHVLGDHTHHVHCVAFSPDGTVVASGGKDGWLRVWDATTGQEQSRWRPHDDHTIESVAFSPNGRMLATGGGMDVKLWDLRVEERRLTGHALRLVVGGHGNAARCVRFSHDGSVVATGAGMGLIRLIDPQTGKELARWYDSVIGEVASLDFSPDDRSLAIGNFEKYFCVWAIPGGTPRRVCISPGGRVRAVAISPDGKLLACGGTDGPVGLWDLSRAAEHVALPASAHPVRFLTFADDARTLVTGTEQGGMAWWDVSADPRLREERQPPGQVGLMRYSAGGKFVLLGGAGTETRLWSPLTGKTDRVPIEVTSWDAAVSREGRWLTTAMPEGRLVLLDLTTGERREFGQPGGSIWQTPTAAPDDGGLLGYRLHDGLSLIDVNSGAELWRLPLTSTPVGVACSGSRQWFAAATREGIVWLANRKPGSQWQTLLGHKNAVNAATFSPDEKTLASCGADGQVKLWQVETGRELLTLQDNPGENVQCVAFSDDGQVLAVGGRSRDGKGFVRLWYGPRHPDGH